MPSKSWTPVTLGDLINVKHGFAFDGAHFRDEPPGDILLTPGNFAIGGGFKNDKFKYYSGPVPKDFVLEAGDLLVTMTDLSKAADTLGFPALVPQSSGPRLLHNQRLGKVLLRPRAPTTKAFLYYLLCSQSYRNEVLASATGTTVKHTSPNRIMAHRLCLPPIEEQGAIAEILGCLDAKIDVNRRMNLTLEAMARAIFKSWFVDFDPIRAKAAGRQPFSMGIDVSAAFPRSLEDSVIGKIPQGWRAAKLGDVIELAYGRGLKESERRPGAVPVYGSNGCVGWHDRQLAAGPGIVVGRKGNPGTVTWAQTPFFPIDTTFYVVPRRAPANLHYIFHMLRSADLPSLGADSAVPGLNRNIAYLSDVLVPPDGALEAFESLCVPLAERVQLNEDESRTLAAIRDALLPKLISGEIRIKDAEKIVGEKV